MKKILVDVLWFLSSTVALIAMFILAVVFLAADYGSFRRKIWKRKGPTHEYTWLTNHPQMARCMRWTLFIVMYPAVVGCALSLDMSLKDIFLLQGGAIVGFAMTVVVAMELSSLWSWKLNKPLFPDTESDQHEDSADEVCAIKYA